MKPFVLFPKTSANVVSTFGTYSPITAFMDDYKKIVGLTPMEGFTAEELEKLMKPRGLRQRKLSLMVCVQRFVVKKLLVQLPSLQHSVRGKLVESAVTVTLTLTDNGYARARLRKEDLHG